MIRAGLTAALAALLGACSTPAANDASCPVRRAYTSLELGVLASELGRDGPQTQAVLEDFVKACPAYFPIAPAAGPGSKSKQGAGGTSGDRRSSPRAAPGSTGGAILASPNPRGDYS